MCQQNTKLCANILLHEMELWWSKLSPLGVNNKQQQNNSKEQKSTIQTKTLRFEKSVVFILTIWAIGASVSWFTITEPVPMTTMLCVLPNTLTWLATIHAVMLLSTCYKIIHFHNVVRLYVNTFKHVYMIFKFNIYLLY